MALVVLPAAGATAAAVFAASAGTAASSGNVASSTKFALLTPFFAAGLAGTAAVLTAIHKALRCEEYQHECLRLSQGYRAIGVLAQSALSTPRPNDLENITNRLTALTESGGAPLPSKYIDAAELRVGHKLYSNGNATKKPSVTPQRSDSDQSRSASA
jgi:hypothetical protein